MRENLVKRQQIACFMVALWVLICLSNVVFRHSHRLPNGRIVSHVHPYAEFGSKCSFPNHHHSQSELNWLDCISNIPFDSFITEVGFKADSYKKPAAVSYVYTEKQTGQRFSVLFLRGPPIS